MIRVLIKLVRKPAVIKRWLSLSKTKSTLKKGAANLAIDAVSVKVLTSALKDSNIDVKAENKDYDPSKDPHFVAIWDSLDRYTKELILADLGVVGGVSAIEIVSSKMSKYKNFVSITDKLGMKREFAVHATKSTFGLLRQYVVSAGANGTFKKLFTFITRSPSIQFLTALSMVSGLIECTSDDNLNVIPTESEEDKPESDLQTSSDVESETHDTDVKCSTLYKRIKANKIHFLFADMTKSYLIKWLNTELYKMELDPEYSLFDWDNERFSYWIKARHLIETLMISKLSEEEALTIIAKIESCYLIGKYNKVPNAQEDLEIVFGSTKELEDTNTNVNDSVSATQPGQPVSQHVGEAEPKGVKL
jgi:hypothetical protein